LFIYVTQGAVFFTSYEVARRALMRLGGEDEDEEEDVGRGRR
jgi:hypothetical protein